MKAIRFYMLSVLFAALSVLGLVSNPAFAGGTFSAGVGSSIDGSGGSFASAGSNGNGSSYQSSSSKGAVYAIGETAVGAAVAFAPMAGAAGGISGSFGAGASKTNAQAYGQTAGDGYGSTKSGVGNDYSYAGYNNVNVSYSY